MKVSQTRPRAKTLAPIMGRTEGNMRNLLKRHDVDFGDVLVVACLVTLAFGLIF